MWQIVPIEVEQTRARIWMGDLQYSHSPVPVTSLEFRLRYAPIDANPKALDANAPLSEPWSRPLPDYPHGVFQVVELCGLKPGSSYRLELQSRARGGGAQAWLGVAAGSLETLPERLPTGGWGAAFRVMLGSCYYENRDNGRVARAFAKLWQDRDERPALKFLVGDQVYLDLGLSQWRLSAAQVQARVLNHYANVWRSLGGMLRHGGSWMLPDDHEYYNNYPFVSGLSNLQLRLSSGYRTAWTKVAGEAVRNIQQVKPVRFLALGDELSVCVLDVRSNRRTQAEGFTDPASLAAVLRWLERLPGPGVLVMSQMLMRNEGNGIDHNLVCFRAQYAALVKAIAGCGHDVVVLAGDVHFSRISDVTLAGGNRLIEVVSSPMSNLTRVNALISARGPDLKPTRFPPVPIVGVPSARVHHRKVISTCAASWNYPKRRSADNFVTVAFLNDYGQVRMRVKAWQVRSNAGTSALPVVDYEYEYELS